MAITQTDIANLALAKVGSQPVQNISDPNVNRALVCNSAYEQTVREVARSHGWNCLMTRARLTQVVGADESTSTPATPANWAPSTYYAAGVTVIFVTTRYLCAVAYTSTSNFINDLTAGFWIQDYGQDYTPSNTSPLYEWLYSYQLPSDYVLLCGLNGTDLRDSGIGYDAPSQGNVEDLYEIYGKVLYTDQPEVDVKYVRYTADPSYYDSLFTNCVVWLLASKIATPLRNDNGEMEGRMLTAYERVILPKARMKDSGEGKPRRYDPTLESNLIRSRWHSTAG